MEGEHSATNVTHKKWWLYLLIGLAVVVILIGTYLFYLSTCLKPMPVIMNAIEENAIILVGKTSWVSRDEIQQLVYLSENPIHKQQFERVLKFSLPGYLMTKEEQISLVYGVSTDEKIAEQLFNNRFKTIKLLDDLSYSIS